MISNPPDWNQILTGDLFGKFLKKNQELSDLLKHAEKDYAYWDDFKHYPMPEGLSPQEAWAYVKFTRISNCERTPIEAIDGNHFSYSITKKMYQKLSYVDSHAGNILALEWQPNTNQKNQMLLSGLTEEAI